MWCQEVTPDTTYILPNKLGNYTYLINQVTTDPINGVNYNYEPFSFHYNPLL